MIRRTVSRRLRGSFALLLFAAVAVSSSARAGETAETVLLVATPELGAAYSHTVLIAKRLAQESYVGVILNRPTRVSLAEALPGHEASRNVAAQLNFGGPIAPDALFALVRTKTSPGDGSVQFAPDLFLAIDGAALDAMLKQPPDRARFYAGVVVWAPGELAEEIASGFWFVRPADTDVVFRTPSEGLWEELVRGARAVTASLSVARW